MGILGNEKNNRGLFLGLLERITGELLSIIGSSLAEL